MEFDLARILKRKAIKQSELADKMGISRGYISDMVAGKKEPSTEMLQRLARALDAKPNEFFLDSHPAQHFPSAGFAEDADAYFAHSNHVQDRRDKAFSAMQNTKNLGTLISNRDLNGFSILKGDHIVIDMARKQDFGALAAVTMMETDTGAGYTYIRRIEEYGVCGPDAMKPHDKWEDTNYNYAVLGKVIGIVRGF